MNRTLITITLALVIGLALLARGQESTQTKNSRQEKQTGNARSVLIPVVFFPRNETTLSSEVTARVVSAGKDMGDTFTRGEVLICLDKAVFQARKHKAEADLKTTEVELKTVEGLYRDHSRSLMELMRARRTVAQARLNLVVATRELEACSIRAPYPGRVVQLMVHAHELVQKGQKLISIVDDRILRARFLAPSTAFGAVKVGQELTITVTEIGRKVQARVTNISAMVDAASGTFEVYAEVDNQAEKLRAGMVGKLQLRVPE